MSQDMHVFNRGTRRMNIEFESRFLYTIAVSVFSGWRPPDFCFCFLCCKANEKAIIPSCFFWQVCRSPDSSYYQKDVVSLSLRSGIIPAMHTESQLGPTAVSAVFTDILIEIQIEYLFHRISPCIKHSTIAPYKVQHFFSEYSQF